MYHLRSHQTLDGENDLGKMPSKRLKVQGSTKRSMTPIDLKQKALFGSENFVNGTKSTNLQPHTQFGTVRPLTQVTQTPLSSKHVSRQNSNKKVVALSIPDLSTIQGKEEGGLVESPTSGKLRINNEATPNPRISLSDNFNTETPSSSESFASSIYISPNSSLSSGQSSEKSSSNHSHLLSRLESTKNKVQMLKGTPLSTESPESNATNKLKVESGQSMVSTIEEQRNQLRKKLKDDGYENPESWLNYIRFEYKAKAEKRIIISFLKRALEKIPEDKYVSSMDYSNLWVIYAKMLDSVEARLNIYRQMQAKGIGIDNANFYSHWAYLELCMKNHDKAIEIIKLGYENDAKPVEKLNALVEQANLDSSFTNSRSIKQEQSPQSISQPLQTVSQNVQAPSDTPFLSQQHSVEKRRLSIPNHQHQPQHTQPHQHQQNQPKPDRYNLTSVREKFDGAAKILESKAFHVNGVPYIDLGLIGRGGSGRVYRVLSPNFKIFALKVVELKEDETFQQFVNEVQLLKDLKGKTDHIIEIIDNEIKYESKKLLILFEYAEIDLDKLLGSKNGKMAKDLETLRFYWKSILKAVEVVHENKIVHGDLKPANFVLVKGQLKLIDFGIAKAICGNTINIRRDDIAGTLNFMAPEALSPYERTETGQQMKLGLPSDVWSLGCILYQMAYGLSPFAQLKEPVLKFAAIVNAQYPIPFTELGDKMQHRQLLDVLKSCLDREPSKRPTIDQLLNHPFLIGD